jgi:hypothetical protein
MNLASVWSLLTIAGLLAPVHNDGGASFAATSIRSGRVASGSVGMKVSTRHRQKPRAPFRRPVVVDGISADDVSVTVEQTQFVSPPNRQTRKSRIYVPPHWVQGEYGVEVLEPGRWIELDAARE